MPRAQDALARASVSGCARGLDGDPAGSPHCCPLAMHPPIEHVGILGLGAFLPKTVRTNDAWPAELLARWRAGAANPTRDIVSAEANTPPPSAGAARVLEALRAGAGDIFQGVRERRVIADDEEPSELEANAARAALADAGLEASDVDLVISSSYCPDRLNVPNACAVHGLLGLGPDVMSLAVECSFNSFSAQLAVAEALLRSGRARRALLVQSCAISRFLRQEDQFSLWMGDAATAVVLGEVSPGYGLLSRVDRTDSSLGHTLACGVPGRRWFEEGRVVLYFEDPAQARAMVLRLVDYGAEAAQRALAQAGLSARDVGFYACHQGTSWLVRVTRAHLGLEHAQIVDTFPTTASVGACNVPLQLTLAKAEGKLVPGDVALLFTGGSGITYSATVLRFGR